MRLARRDRARPVEGEPTEEQPAPAASSEGADQAPRRRVLRAQRAGSDDAPAESPAEGSGGLRSEEAPPESRSRKGRIRALFDEQVAHSREQTEQEAALELRQFMEPARQQLVLSVPGSTSPEEAEAMLSSQAAIVLDKPVEVSPETVVDLRNPSSMRAYPPAEKLSNRVLRLADRHWTKDKRRPPAEIMAEQAAINEQEFARRPVGTQRCLAQWGSLRCRGVFAYGSAQQADGSAVACPMCGSAHSWEPETETWVLSPTTALGEPAERGSITAGA